jgi:acyl-coenzyme A thioesterase PaaI-like protein
MMVSIAAVSAIKKTSGNRSLFNRSIQGHPRITHGGFSAALIDETAGGLIFKLKQAGKLGPGPAYTARLEVDYKLPLQTQTVVVCTARVVSIEGRKVWVEVKMRDSTAMDSVVFAAGKALFVTPRQHSKVREEAKPQDE